MFKKIDKELLCRSARRLARLVELDAPAGIVLSEINLLLPQVFSYINKEMDENIRELLRLKRLTRKP